MATKPFVRLAAALGLAVVLSVTALPAAHATSVTTGVSKTLDPRTCPATKAVSASDLSNYTTLQGVTDGSLDVVYAIFSAGGNDTILTTWFGSTLATLSCTRVAKLNLGHGNDITYQPDWSGGSKLLVPMGYQSEPSRVVSVVDELSMTKTTFTAKDDVSGICYTSSHSGWYAVRDARHVSTYSTIKDMENGTAMASWTESVLKYPTGEQGVYCTSSYVYTVNSIAKGSDSKTNYIRQYTWGGSLHATYTYNSPAVFSSSNAQELEGLFKFNGSFVMGLNLKHGVTEELVPVSL